MIRKAFKEWKEVNDKLYGLWEDGIIPSNFSEEHSDYDTAVRLLLDDLISEEELIDFLNRYNRFLNDLFAIMHLE